MDFHLGSRSFPVPSSELARVPGYNNAFWLEAAVEPPLNLDPAEAHHVDLGNHGYRNCVFLELKRTLGKAYQH